MDEVNWRQLPALTTLRAFEATARLQGYSAAARALNVTPAAIAQQVRKLEAEVGVSLVRREGRGLVLTEAGKDLAAPMREAFALIASCIDNVKHKEATRGVRVSTTRFFVDSVIVPNLGDFWQQHSGVQASFSPEGNLHPVDLDKYDIVIRGDFLGDAWKSGFDQPAIEPNAIIRRILESPVVICAAPSLLGSGPVDLSTLPWIQNRSMSDALFNNLVTQAGADPSKIQFVDPGDAKFEIEATIQGYGLIINPKLVVDNLLQSGELVTIDTPLETMGTYYAIHRNGPLSGPSRLFLDWLTALCVKLSD